MLTSTEKTRSHNFNAIEQMQINFAVTYTETGARVLSCILQTVNDVIRVRKPSFIYSGNGIQKTGKFIQERNLHILTSVINRERRGNDPSGFQVFIVKVLFLTRLIIFKCPIVYHICVGRTLQIIQMIVNFELPLFVSF